MYYATTEYMLIHKRWCTYVQYVTIQCYRSVLFCLCLQNNLTVQQSVVQNEQNTCRMGAFVEFAQAKHNCEQH